MEMAKRRARRPPQDAKILLAGGRAHGRVGTTSGHTPGGHTMTRTEVFLDKSAQHMANEITTGRVVKIHSVHR